MSAFGLAKQLGILVVKHNFMVTTSNATLALCSTWNTRSTAWKQGFVETIYGRRLHLPEIQSRSITSSKAAERAAINAPMQGTAADIIKKAMLLVDEWIQAEEAMVV